jgi:uncharacterized RDD family membrane protein YckC
MQKENNISTVPAKIPARIIAFIVDSMLILLLITLFKKINPHENVSTNTLNQIKSNINISLVFSFYSLIFTNYIFKGQTIGKKLMGIRIITEGSDKVDLMTLLNREILGKVFIERINLWILLILSQTRFLDNIMSKAVNSSNSLILWYVLSLPWVMFLSFAMMVNNKEHISLHDKVARTRVVSKA